MQACVRDLAYDIVDSSLSPCLVHLLGTPAEAVVSNMYKNCMRTDNHQQAGDGNFKM